jgi:hypothetical protein
LEEYEQPPLGPAREKSPELTDPAAYEGDALFPREQRRLTRAAFSETLKQHSSNTESVFDIKGLHRMPETFRALDNSVGKDFDGNEGQKPGEPEVSVASPAKSLFIFWMT